MTEYSCSLVNQPFMSSLWIFTWMLLIPILCQQALNLLCMYYVLAFISSSLISLNISTLLHSLQDLMTGKCQDICLKPKYFNSWRRNYLNVITTTCEMFRFAIRLVQLVARENCSVGLLRAWGGGGLEFRNCCGDPAASLIVIHSHYPQHYLSIPMCKQRFLDLVVNIFDRSSVSQLFSDANLWLMACT